MRPVFHTKGPDQWHTPRQTVWQREKMRGQILPMEAPRRGWLRRLFRHG